MYVDSHCHLDFPGLSERLPEVLSRMQDNRVTHALCVAVTLEDFPRVFALAQAYPHLYASVGVHPDSTECREPDVDTLVSLATQPKVIATGETGLDYFRAARRSGRPLLIHTRSAAADTLAIMREEGADEVGGVMHCFTETWDVAQAALDLGFYISISGIVTFRNADALRDVARRVPAERLLIETDSPYLAPVPHRGKTNEPGFVRHVGESIAALREVTPELLAEQTRRNFFCCFRINEPSC